MPRLPIAVGECQQGGGQTLKSILLTGATGFIGCHLAHGLLRNGKSLVLVARDSREASAAQRVGQLLSHLDRYSDDANPRNGTYEVINGDVRYSKLGVEEDILARALDSVDEIWHCAVLSSFDEQRADEIKAVNTTGTHNVIELAKSFGISRFHYLSTAYVAGDRRGVVCEQLYTGQHYRNTYEQTKGEMERFLLERAVSTPLEPTIYRLGIVVGDSRTGETTSFNGYYNLARTFHKMRQQLLERNDQDRGEMRAAGVRIEGSDVIFPVRIPCASDATVNLITIDFVTRVLREIGDNPQSVGKIVHITNPAPVNGRYLWEKSLKQLGVGGFRFVEDAEEIQRYLHPEGISPLLEQAMFGRLKYYVEYLQGEPKFDTSNAQALSQDYDHPEFTPELIGRLLQFAIHACWGRER